MAATNIKKQKCSLQKGQPWIVIKSKMAERGQFKAQNGKIYSQFLNNFTLFSTHFLFRLFSHKFVWMASAQDTFSQNTKCKISSHLHCFVNAFIVWSTSVVHVILQWCLYHQKTVFCHFSTTQMWNVTIGDCCVRLSLSYTATYWAFKRLTLRFKCPEVLSNSSKPNLYFISNTHPSCLSYIPWQ